MVFAAPRFIFAAPLVLLISAAILTPAWAQDAGVASLAEYDNVPPGLLLTPAQRLDHAANVVPTVPTNTNTNTNATAGLVAPDEIANPTVDPQMPTQSMAVFDKKPEAEAAPRIMGMSQIEAAYAKGEYEPIIRPLETLVGQNDPQAILLLGVMMDAGQGTPANPQRAVELFARAAELGLPQAQHRLALQYYQGRGVAKNMLNAMMWLHIASANYKDGPQKQRALGDRNNLQAAMSRRDRETAMFMAREWMTKKGIVHLLDDIEKPAGTPSTPASVAPSAPATPQATQPSPATPTPAVTP